MELEIGEHDRIRHGETFDALSKGGDPVKGNHVDSLTCACYGSFVLTEPCFMMAASVVKAIWSRSGLDGHRLAKIW